MAHTHYQLWKALGGTLLLCLIGFVWDIPRSEVSDTVTIRQVAKHDVSQPLASCDPRPRRWRERLQR